MTSQDDNTDLMQRIAIYRTYDAARQEHIENLAQEYAEIKNALTNLQVDLDDERQSRRVWRQRAELAETAINRSQFVLVLIDGDGYRFNNSFFNLPGDSGGAQAANAIYGEIQEYLKGNNMLENGMDIDIMVTVYVNKLGLAKALHDADIIQSPQQLDRFFWSFTQNNSLFQLIDCGPGKERVDAKLRDTYRFYAYNTHCKYIFLACCHDNGYVAELDKYRHDRIAAPKTLFVRHDNTARQYAIASLPFPVARFGSVFESAPLQSVKRGDIQQAPPSKTVQAPDDSGSQSVLEATPLAKTTSYSSVTSGVKLPTRSTSNVTSPTPDNVEAVTAKTGIPVNRSSQRVDRRIQAPSAAELERFERRIVNQKLCNVHHLTAEGCYTYNCRFDHSAIDQTMLHTLRYKARSIPCAQGVKCRKADCFYGHQCPWGEKNCANPNCAFEKKGLHDIKDLEIAKFVPAAPA